jgi:hypothetical protein
MFISGELKSERFLQHKNFAATYSAETNSAVLYDIYDAHNYGVGQDMAAWIHRHFGLRYYDLSERGTIIRVEDFAGVRVPRASVDSYYGYLQDGDKLYQMTAYISAAIREEYQLPKLDEAYKERRVLLFIKNGKIGNYHTTVRTIDVPRMRVINNYCKQVNKYLRVAAAMGHLRCVFGNNYSSDTHRVVAKSLQERESPQEAAFRVIEDMGDSAIQMPLVRASEVYSSAFCAPSIQMEYLYVRE